MFGSLSVRCGSGGGGGVLEEEEAVNREKEAAWKEIQFHQSDEIHEVYNIFDITHCQIHNELEEKDENHPNCHG